jgi:ADP-glucose pyrophosphorylase
MCDVWLLERTKQDQMLFHLTRGRLWTHRDASRPAQFLRAGSQSSDSSAISGAGDAFCQRLRPESERLGLSRT